MSWKPVLDLIGPSGANAQFKSGRSLVTANVITFDTPYPDRNYTITLTPYVVESTSNYVPQVWVIFDSITPGSFRFNSIGADGVFWSTIYASNS